MFGRRRFMPIEDRGPLRVMYLATDMAVGGAETLLVELVRRLDRARFLPELCCLKQFGPLGEVLAQQIPAFTGLLSNKYDATVLWRLARLLRRRRIDALVTVGTGGDRMFWGRLAARLARVPVVCSWLHSMGLPQRVEWPNRLLAPLTDAFIAVAEPHGRYLAEHEGCPKAKVRVIPNGVDVERFRPRAASAKLQEELGLTGRPPVAAIVAALRWEKNHELFLEVASDVRRRLPAARFLIVGDGPEREKLLRRARELSLTGAVQFLGARADVPEVLSLADCLVLTSHMEANPVSILEAMAAGKPVVATRVGSVEETVRQGETGYLAAPSDRHQLAARVAELLTDRSRAEAMGRAAREEVVRRWSVERMVEGHQNLMAEVYSRKAGKPPRLSAAPAQEPLPSAAGP